jgi:hypothetical protein
MATNVFTDTAADKTDDWNGFHLRMILAAANLKAAPGATHFAVTFANSSGAVTTNIDSAWMGHQGTVQVYNFDGNQVQLTFNGATFKNGLGASALVQSDFVPFSSYNPAKPLIVATHVSGTTSYLCGLNFSALDQFSRKFEADTQTGVTAPTGVFTTAGFEYFVTSVDCINLVLQAQACL